MAPTFDDLGVAVSLPGSIDRVVSLVPSLTESLAASAPGLLVGATDWCTHPADLDVTRVGGTKNPDVAGIVALAPDLVLANEEENRAADLDALREAGVAVWVTQVRTVDEAFTSLARMLAACRVAPPRWLDDALAAWAAVVPGAAWTAAIPIWRRPWMVLGRDTFAGDVLARLGIRNAFDGSAERYPRVALESLRAVELVVLPDEPYAFSPTDGPECFPGQSVALVSGRHLTWYGPSMVDAPQRPGRATRVSVRRRGARSTQSAIGGLHTAPTLRMPVAPALSSMVGYGPGAVAPDRIEAGKAARACSRPTRSRIPALCLIATSRSVNGVRRSYAKCGAGWSPS